MTRGRGGGDQGTSSDKRPEGHGWRSWGWSDESLRRNWGAGGVWGFLSHILPLLCFTCAPSFSLFSSLSIFQFFLWMNLSPLKQAINMELNNKHITCVLEHTVKTLSKLYLRTREWWHIQVLRFSHSKEGSFHTWFQKTVYCSGKVRGPKPISAKLVWGACESHLPKRKEGNSSRIQWFFAGDGERQ